MFMNYSIKTLFIDFEQIIRTGRQFDTNVLMDLTISTDIEVQFFVHRRNGYANNIPPASCN